MVKHRAQYKVEIPDWNSLSVAQKELISVGLSKSKIWCFQALTEEYDSVLDAYVKHPVITDMSIQFDDPSDNNYCYIIPISDDQTPRSSNDPFYGRYDEAADQYVFYNLKTLNVTSVVTHLFKQSKFPDRVVDDYTVSREEICSVVVTLFVDGVENTNLNITPIFDYGDEYQYVGVLSLLHTEDVTSNFVDEYSDGCLNRLNKCDVIQIRDNLSYYAYSEEEFHVDSDCLKDLYLKVVEHIPENLGGEGASPVAMMSSGTRSGVKSSGVKFDSFIPTGCGVWVKISKDLYSIDSEGILSFSESVYELYEIDTSSSDNICVLYDYAAMHEKFGVNQVTGVLTIDQSPFAFPTSYMDSSAWSRYTAKSVNIDYSKISVNSFSRDPVDGEWYSYGFSNTDGEPTSYLRDEKEVRLIIDGKWYKVLGLKEFDESKKSYVFNNSENLRDLTLINESDPNAVVTAYCTEISEEEIEFYDNIIQLSVDSSLYKNSTTSPRSYNMQISVRHSSEKSNTYKYQLYTSDVVSDGSTEFHPDPDKEYTLLSMGVFGVPYVCTNDSGLVSKQEYLPDEDGWQVCAEMLDDGRVWVGTNSSSGYAQYIQRCKYFTFYYLVTDK